MPGRFKIAKKLDMLYSNLKKQINNNTSLYSEEKEVDRYSMDSFDIELEDDLFNFWNAIKEYPIIAPHACNILCMPASTAPIERVF